MKKLSALILCAWWLIGCEGNHSAESQYEMSSIQASAEVLQSFQETVYTFGRAQGCVNCHGGKTSPLWVNENLQTAYAFARPFLNLRSPTSSKLAVQAGNNHCNDASCSSAANVAVMQDLLAQWAAVELDYQGGEPPDLFGTPLATPAYVTQTRPIPASLPLVTSQGGPAIVRFDLTMLTPQVASLNGVILEVSIRSYNALGTTYKIYNPRLVGNATAVRIKGIHIYVRPAAGSGLGTEDLNQGLGWSMSNLNIQPEELPVPLPPGPLPVAPLITTSLGIASQSAADVITIGFEELN